MREAERDLIIDENAKPDSLCDGDSTMWSEEAGRSGRLARA